MHKLWLFIWIIFGAYALVAAYGGGGFGAALMAMISGFMCARNIAEILSTT
jgi:hypothetical protein